MYEQITHRQRLILPDLHQARLDARAKTPENPTPYRPSARTGWPVGMIRLTLLRFEPLGVVGLQEGDQERLAILCGAIQIAPNPKA